MGIRLIAAAAALLSTTVAAHAYTFTEKDFPTSRDAFSNTYTFGEGDVSAGQCQTCGINGSKALRFIIQGGPTYSGSDLGVSFTNATYNAASGPLASIYFSVQKDLIFPGLATTTNTFHPLIKEGGTYYIGSISLPAFDGPGTTGFLKASGTLTADDFLSFNFNTGSYGTAHPDFSNGTLHFGLAQFSTGYTDAITIYDNFSVKTNAVPEPTTWAMMVLGFGMMGFGLRSRRKQSVRVTYA